METLKFIWHVTRILVYNEYYAWCKGLESIARYIENWSYELAMAMVEPIRNTYLSGPPEDIEWEIATAEEMKQKARLSDWSYEISAHASKMAVEAMQAEEDAKIMERLKNGGKISSWELPYRPMQIDYDKEVEQIRAEQMLLQQTPFTPMGGPPPLDSGSMAC